MADRATTQWPARVLPARNGTDYPVQPDGLPESTRDADGDISHGRYPIVPVSPESDLDPMLAVSVPGIGHHHDYDPGTGI